MIAAGTVVAAILISNVLYCWSRESTLSSITTNTLSKIATSSKTSNSFPAGVSASEITSNHLSRQEMGRLCFGLVAVDLAMYYT